MITRGNGRAYECVTVDLNTQRDFCDSTGAYPVANVTELIPALRRVIAWTMRNYVPIVSCIDAHRPCEITDGDHRACCVDGTIGQRKVEFTVFPRCARVEVDNTLAVPLDLFESFQQVIFRKRTDDLLSNPKADRFLTQLPANEFLVFGNTVESSVKSLVLGLLARQKPATLVGDACGYWSRSSADLALRQMCAKGAHIITVDELLTRKLSRRRRYRVVHARSALANACRCGGGAASGGPDRKNGRSRARTPRPRLNGRVSWTENRTTDRPRGT